MKYEKKGRIVIVAVLVVFFIVLGASGREIDPNTMPFTPDPNQYTAPITFWTEADPNVSIAFETTIRNKGGWNVDLSVSMADGSPTSVAMNSLSLMPVKDIVAGGFKKVYAWSWTPPAEGVYYLEVRASTRGKPQWKGDVKTVIIYAYGQDAPTIEMPDPPVITLDDRQRTWQDIQKARAVRLEIGAFERTLPQVAAYLRQWIVSDAGEFAYYGPVRWAWR